MIIKKFKSIYGKYFKIKNIFLANLIVFLLLLMRNPFSQRTLIPNLEPFPDTIFYLSPARSLARGGPFKVIREGREMVPNVPPLYSLTLVPFYLLNNDVRMFYFANVFMSILSFYLFFKIIRKFTDDKWILLFSSFIFITNFFLYWYPQWAMSENLLLPLFLMGVLLMVSKLNYQNIVLAAFIPIAFYATKYASAPMTLWYYFIYIIKIIIETIKSKGLFKKIIIYLLLVGLFSFPVFLYGYLTNGMNPIGAVTSLFKSLLSSTTISSTNTSNTSGAWMSMQYFNSNLHKYSLSLVGGSNKLLWDNTPIVPIWIGVLGLLGLMIGFFIRKTRPLSFCVSGLLFSELLFMSTFYALDVRYIYIAIPTIFLGLMIFLLFIQNYLSKRKFYYLFILIITSMLAFYISQNAVRLKSQIVINAKYAETPWYYISVLKLNSYFKEKGMVKPIVISPMPPYYIDYYSNDNYELLPLSTEQEFRSSKNLAWGERDYSDLQKIYLDYLKEGRSLYVSTYGLGNEAYLHNAFDSLKKKFKTSEIYVDCYGQCNLYKLEIN